jgi:hypothetical protein
VHQCGSRRFRARLIFLAFQNEKPVPKGDA